METMLLKMSLGGAVLIAVILLIRLVGLNRLPKRLFPLLWCLALLRLLTPLSVPIPAGLSLPTLPVSERPASRPADTFVPADPVDIQGTLPDTSASAPVVPGDSAPQKTASAKDFPLIPTVWAAAALGLGLYFVLSRARLCRELRTAVPVKNAFALRWMAAHRLRRRVELRELAGLPSPLTYGIVRPVILVPRGFDWSDQATAAYVLYHETTHIRRFDAAQKLLMAAALCLHWFNPLVWAMYFLFDRDLELACDEAVLRYYGAGRRRDYAETIIGMEEKRALPAPFGSFFSMNTAEERIRAIMKFDKNSVIALALALILAVAGTLTVFATAGNENKTPPPAGGGDTTGAGGTAGTDDTTQAVPSNGAGLVYTFNLDGLQLEVTGVRKTRIESGMDDGGAYYSCPVYILEPGAALTVLEADMFEDEEGVRRGSWALYTAAGEYIYIVDGMEPVTLTPDILGVVDPESSLYILVFTWTEKQPVDSSALGDSASDTTARPSQRTVYRDAALGVALEYPAQWNELVTLYSDVTWEGFLSDRIDSIPCVRIDLRGDLFNVPPTQNASFSIDQTVAYIYLRPAGVSGPERESGAGVILARLEGGTEAVCFLPMTAKLNYTGEGYGAVYNAFDTVEKGIAGGELRTRVLSEPFEFTMDWGMEHTGELSDRELTVFAARSDGAYAEAAGSELGRRFIADPYRLLNALATEQDANVDSAVYLLAGDLYDEERGDALDSVSKPALTAQEAAVLEAITEQYNKIVENNK